MSRALLDINVLLALLDSDHVDHARAMSWLDTEIDAGWASCPVTENGFVRIISQPRYPSPVAPSIAVELLSRAQRSDAHAFWPCDLSLLDAERFDGTRLHGPRQVTDAYLLGLAVAQDGRFATFDQSVPLSAVRGADERHLAVL